MATPGARRSRMVELQDYVEPEPNMPPSADIFRRNAFRVERKLGFVGGQHDVVHSWGLVLGNINWQTCCRVRRAGVSQAPEGAVVNCIYCTLCIGCVACKDGMINETTVSMGHWTTAKRRMVFPFEMDDQHVVNALRKLMRDEDGFKKNWRRWVTVLATEANLRGLDW